VTAEPVASAPEPTSAPPPAHTPAPRPAKAPAHAKPDPASHPPGAAVSPASASQLVMYRAVRAIVAGFCRLFWRVKVEGRDNIPSEGPFILSPVHRSNIDSPLMAVVTRRRMHFMGKDTLWRYRWSTWFFNSMGGFPVHREGADREALRTCETLLRQGEPVVVFPEGTRKSGPMVESLFEGAAFMAARTGAPIVPVGIGGSARAMPVGSKSIRPVKVRIVIGPPIRPPERASGSRAARHQVHELTTRLQAELQRLYHRAEPD